jgi:hypothetical protein
MDGTSLLRLVARPLVHACDLPIDSIEPDGSGASSLTSFSPGRTLHGRARLLPSQSLDLWITGRLGVSLALLNPVNLRE